MCFLESLRIGNMDDSIFLSNGFDRFRQDTERYREELRSGMIVSIKSS